MPYYGTYTKTDLRSVDWFAEANQGGLNREAARFGLELAQFAYDFNAAPWLAAGWTDISMQVDRRLLTGVRGPGDEAGWRQMLLNTVVPRLARGLTLFPNPIAEIRGAIKQNVLPETGKAVTMVLALPEGRFIVAVGFMGTGRRPQDWVSNMRFSHPDGLHEGFLSLALQYEQNAQGIQFPSIAQALGVERFTMKDVLEECGKPDSRFRLVLAGHSQGAAVLQVWAYRRNMEGLRREHFTGFGYASPMVAAGLSIEGMDCPLTHFLSSDDIFTRMGLLRHIGQCVSLPADDAFRQLVYGRAMKEPLFREMLGIFQTQKGTADGLTLCLGFLEALSRRPHKVVASALAVFFDSTLLELAPATATEEWLRRLMRFALDSFRRYYREATSTEPDASAVDAARSRVEALMSRHGAVAFSRMLVRALYLTHSLVNTEPGRGDLAPYSYMVVRAFSDLQPCEDPLSSAFDQLSSGNE